MGWGHGNSIPWPQFILGGDALLTSRTFHFGHPPVPLAVLHEDDLDEIPASPTEHPIRVTTRAALPLRPELPAVEVDHPLGESELAVIRLLLAVRPTARVPSAGARADLGIVLEPKGLRMVEIETVAIIPSIQPATPAVIIPIT